MAKFSSFLGLALALAIFTSCEKEEETPQTPEVTQQTCLLSKVLDQNNNPIIEIAYNSQKQAISYIDHPEMDVFTYSYANNKLAAATHAHTHSGPGDFIQTYTIDPEGLVSKVDLVSAHNSNYQFFWRYDYDQSKRLIKKQYFNKGLNGQPDVFREAAWFVYNNNGNAEMHLSTNVFATAQDTAGTGYLLEYDTKPNPFYPLRNLPSVMSWSENNPVKVFRTRYDSTGKLISQTLAGTFQNDYNSEGLLVKSTYFVADDPVIMIRKYEYICN